jgi:meso-butanediol dehydrogenase / (S,S)-butanediol dehydrogenase / diacetyl reductase
MKDKVALITGGACGIGRAIALAFAQEGATVIIADRLFDEMEKTVSAVKALGTHALGVQIDLGQREALKSLVDQVLSRFPLIHILVNNAGIGSGQYPKSISEYDDEFWDLSLFVNLTVPYLLTKAFLPSMIRHGWGRVINISSVAGKMGLKHGCAYSSSKHGLIGLTRTAALEVASNGITVNAICPGHIGTTFGVRRLEHDAKQKGILLEEFKRSCNPIQRLLEPEEVANMALFLCSDGSGGITGQALNISGGYLMD